MFHVMKTADRPVRCDLVYVPRWDYKVYVSFGTVYVPRLLTISKSVLIVFLQLEGQRVR